VEDAYAAFVASKILVDAARAMSAPPANHGKPPSIPIARYEVNKTHQSTSSTAIFTLPAKRKNLIDSEFQCWLPPAQVSGSGASGSARPALNARP
jgi:hypothetical protein